MLQSEFEFGLCGLLILIMLVVISARHSRRSTPYPLPPGPPGEPILGHLRLIPADNPELYYQKTAKEYNSDIIYFLQLRTPVIILNSVKAADELLSKRGANYSDRPRFVLFEVMGWGLTLTFLPWGPRFKAHRSVLQTTFTKSNIVKFQLLQEQEARQAISSIIKNPADWETYIRRFASAIVLRIAFGVTLTGDDDPHIQIAIDANTAAAEGGSPGATVVDYFPFLSMLPGWMVPSKALRHARQWRWAIQRLHDIPFAAAREAFESGTAQSSSLVSSLLQMRSFNQKNRIHDDFTMADINGAAAAIFIAGSDTTYNTVLVGLLAFLLYPRVLQKARQTLDNVLGNDRLPSLSDRSNPELRYIDHIVEEISRWRPLSPLGVPHKSLKPDIYNGMYIPPGSSIYFNAWAMGRDESIYRSPDEFNPDRYANGEPFLAAPFGFGRRACVGKHLAQASVWILLATLIAAMDVEKPIGKDGKEVEPVVKFSTGLSSHPAHFDCNFKARSRNF